MKNVKFGVLLVVILLTSSNVIAQTDFHDPNILLSKADSAISNLESISYHAEHYTIGILNIRGKKYLQATLEGDVTLLRLPKDSAFGAKILVDGEIVNASPSQKSQSFKFIYNGDKIFKIPFYKEVVYVREPDQIGKLLSVESQELIFQGFINPKYFSKEIKIDSISYAGQAVINSIPANIVYTKTINDSYLKETWWFLGSADFLPRKILTRYSGTNGRDRMVVSVFTDLKKNIQLGSNYFAIRNTLDYKVSKFQGFSKPSSLLDKGETAPKWTLKDAEGNKHSLSDYKGKIVILDFWATWCGPCRKVMPKLQKINEKYTKNEVAVIGISIWETGNPKSFMEEKNLNYQLLINGDKVANKYNVRGIPTLYIIGQNGKIIYSKVGTFANGYEKLVSIIERNL